jgi:hypothetical protein
MHEKHDLHHAGVPDAKIDIKDISLVARYFGKSYHYP